MLQLPDRLDSASCNGYFAADAGMHGPIRAEARIGPQRQTLR